MTGLIILLRVAMLQGPWINSRDDCRIGLIFSLSARSWAADYVLRGKVGGYMHTQTRRMQNWLAFSLSALNLAEDCVVHGTVAGCMDKHTRRLQYWLVFFLSARNLCAAIMQST